MPPSPTRVTGARCAPDVSDVIKSALQAKERVMADAPARKKVTINTLMSKMKKGEPITQLAAYDYRTAVVADRLRMDILCVSDTGGMILFRPKSTVPVSFHQI